MPNKKKDKNIEVYFNSACPVCNAGINYQKKRIGDIDLSDGCPGGDEGSSEEKKEEGGETLNVSWVDISSVSNKDNTLENSTLVETSRMVGEHDGRPGFSGVDARIARSNIEFVKERLHVIDQDNNVHIGMDAFIIIWELSPKDRRKAKFFSIPVIHALSVISYNIFAWLLYRWNRLLKHW